MENLKIENKVGKECKTMFNIKYRFKSLRKHIKSFKNTYVYIFLAI